ncbi:DUF2812 domain-containing protein [Floccifex sp.]|uniref:DUF2812 domain-containing protein n=1 Tax=Floccifex sp. TaxID=2815810 RepID=UPI002A7496D2|nr:DUF2812 domain-containing protein [Floccifex sp.]MDD7280696.1 DUF2812 domain-containing protein [Erysipelotrichaceae bacterium]MDY2957703.1 DUF2812 domain-containing protein [Floccifex sp.]
MAEKRVLKRSKKEVNEALEDIAPFESQQDIETSQSVDSFVMDTPVVQPQEEQANIEYEIDEDMTGDVFYEKKKFYITEYEKEESYLEKKSRDGYHFIKANGNKYYFRQSAPKDYYYQLIYFVDDPSHDQWQEWEKEGWTLMAQRPGKKNHEAGWFLVRNELGFGEYKKTIDNDLEKFNLFKRQANSYRSTMFLYFVVMAICGVTIFMTFKINGFLEALIASGIILLISLILFFVYAYHLTLCKRAVNKLKTRLRLKERDDFIRSQNEPDYSQTQQQLDTDWNTMEQSLSDKKVKKRRKK